MKKIISFTSVLAIAASSLVSCNKQTDVKTVDSQTNNGGSGGSGGSSGFNWTGAEPFSVKVDGTAFPLDKVKVVLMLGYYSIMVDGTDGTHIGLSIPENAAPGLVYSMPSPANVSWTSATSPTLLLGASPGKVKITTNNATTLEGYFTADTRDYTGASAVVVRLTEGYFKVNKP